MAVNRNNPNPLRRGLKKVELLLNRTTMADSPVVRIACLTLVRHIKIKLSTPGRGRIRQDRLKVGRTRQGYAVVHIGKAGRASVPGDPPAVDRGALRSSIGYDIGGYGPSGSASRVGSGLPYAPVQEFGTTTAGVNHDTVIEPRPFMRPGLEAAREEMGGAVVAELRRQAETVL